MEQFRCVKKCYFNEQRWKVNQVFKYIEGERDPNGKPLRTPEQAGVGKCFQRVTPAQAVLALEKLEEERSVQSRPTRRKSEPVDFKDKYDTHD